MHRHMKQHFQPLVKKSSAAVVAIKVGEEVDILRNNVQGLNGKLAQYMAETNIHDDGYFLLLVSCGEERR